MDRVISSFLHPMGATDKARVKTDSRNPPCKKRAEWRLLPGKSPERLSAYYQLPCDFGAAIMGCWGSEESSEPIYFCEAHVQEFQSSAAYRKMSGPLARVKEGQAEPATKKGPKPLPVPSAKSSPAVTPTKTIQASNYGSTKSLESLANRFEAIQRQIGVLASQVENILSESDATIDLASAVDAPLEQAILEIIADASMNDSQKDAAIARLDELQKSLKPGAGERMSLLDAYRMQRSLAACLNGSFGVPADLKSGYRAVHDSLDRAIRAALTENAVQLVSA